MLFRDLGLTCGLLLLVRLFLLVAAANPTAFALDPSKTITQYNHQVWKTHDGLPSNSVLAILQSRDGFLWLGTQNGLVRFDGVSFKVFTGANVSELTDNRINCLFIILRDTHSTRPQTVMNPGSCPRSGTNLAGKCQVSVEAGKRGGETDPNKVPDAMSRLCFAET